jgi:SAM-dependent methyltransferase
MDLNVPEGRMNQSDPFAEFKKRQREMWASFTPAALFTTPVAGQLVKFAGIASGEDVLDVATGTGVVAVTAARAGAHVTGLDLTPELLDQARENARIAKTEDIVWTEGDAENLPYPDASFDVVVSQFGHIFAPRPEFAVKEMRRVLRPGGRIAFATWPPEHMIGRFFVFIGRNSAPPPPGVAPPAQWGIPAIIAERLAESFEAPFFMRGRMNVPALSVEHILLFLEKSVGPMQKLVESLAGDPSKLSAIRAESAALVLPYYEDNVVHQDYLLTRARTR